MFLTDKEKELLSNCVDNRTRVTVTGKNALGQFFSSEGFIKEIETNSYEEFFTVYLGTDFDARIYTVPTCRRLLGQYYSFSALIVDKIFIDGKEVYKNKDFEEIIKNSRYLTNQYKDQKMNNLPAYGKRFLELIGKPVKLLKKDKTDVPSVFYNLEASEYTDEGVYVVFASGFGLRDPILPGDLVVDKKAYSNLDKYEEAGKVL